MKTGVHQPQLLLRRPEVLPHRLPTVGRLTPNARAAALTEPPVSRKSRTARCFSESSAGGLPPVLPSAAARSTLALIRPRMESLSHSAKDKSMCSIGLEVGCGAAVPGVQALRQGADVDPLVVEILEGSDSLSEVLRQPVDSRDHDPGPRGWAK